ncbi:FAD-dependent oxidoreductase [Sphaerothrix gracilis]|uniref:FAD-dependent oxidoreductase n=1 Tax=Sphaerothrix gracilis TaxID=3151835 RepID=UPI0031FC75CF
MSYSHIIVGGGAYGCYLALKLTEIAPAAKILIIEREDELLLRASYNNQARIHNGYHYPRSLLTALRSRVNFPRFIQEFSESVVNDFEKVYALASQRSQVTAKQFYNFCQRIGADAKVAPPRIKKLFNHDYIEDVFLAKEYAFDARKLREILALRLARTSVTVLTGAEAIQVESLNDNSQSQKLSLLVESRHTGQKQAYLCDYLYNCTYASLNSLLARSGLEIISLKHEATEMALVEVPDCLHHLGITIMCGPFFSVMPFPDKGLSTFSHVSYTPHYDWRETGPLQTFRSHQPEFPLKSSFNRMVKDAVRYLPSLANCVYRGSLWETKTILPRSDGDDSRPILFKENALNSKVISVLGGKIDNIFELDEALTTHH